MLFVCVFVFVRLFLCLCLCLRLRLFLCLCASSSSCFCVFAFVFVSLCMSVFVGVCVCQIFSRSARPNSVNRHFIIWPYFFMLFKREKRGRGWLINEARVNWTTNDSRYFMNEHKRAKNHSTITQTTASKRWKLTTRILLLKFTEQTTEFFTKCLIDE